MRKLQHLLGRIKLSRLKKFTALLPKTRNRRADTLAYVSAHRDGLDVNQYLMDEAIREAENDSDEIEWSGSGLFLEADVFAVNEPANISRVDLYADFCAECEMDAFDPLRDWVTRVEIMTLHYSYGRFSGWSFGSGGDIVARLYDKTLEVEKKSHKFYLHELWKAAGWDGESQVWRMEFEAKRNALVSPQLPKLAHLLPNQAALWRYLTENWLRLTVPTDSDSNRARWNNHPLWDFIAAAFNTEGDQAKLQRFNHARLPEDERLFVHGLGGITSFMASRGIEDLGEGIGEYLHQAKAYHVTRSGFKHDGMERYVGRKVKAKNRRYNPVNNVQQLPSELSKIEAAAVAYQQAKGGEDDAV